MTSNLLPCLSQLAKWYILPSPIATPQREWCDISFLQLFNGTIQQSLSAWRVFLKHALIRGVATLNINLGPKPLRHEHRAINRAVMAGAPLNYGQSVPTCSVWRDMKSNLGTLLWDADWNLQGYTHATDSHVGLDTLRRTRRVISKACIVLKSTGMRGTVRS